MNQDMTEKLTKNKMVLAVAAFALVTLAMIVIGIMALKVPAVAMCVLIILEAGLLQSYSEGIRYACGIVAAWSPCSCGSNRGICHW